VATPKSTSPVAAFESDELQRQAIEHVEGPMLVVAGAGTGKTTVLTRRIAHLIREVGIAPNNLVATTYTDNAAREMGERVRSELRGMNTAGLQLKTFHAYCNELLHRAGRQFRVLDEKDLWIFLRRRLPELNLHYYVRAANVAQFLTDLLNFMQRCQDELVSPEKYADYVSRLESRELPIPRVSHSKDELSDEEVMGRCREISAVYATVERMLKEDNLGTFGHMITHAYALLESDPVLLSKERERTRYLLVDEFQDANFAQVKILQLLGGEARNVFAVGDPDQAIYRFRGASSAAFGLFQNVFPGAKMVVLNKNRRSTTPILETAFAIISQNPSGFPSSGSLQYKRSRLVSAREEEALSSGVPLKSIPVDIVTLVDKSDKEVESGDVIHTIKERQKQLRCNWGDFAVLYRQHSHRDVIAEDLQEEGIPFAIENMDVMDTADVRDVVACISAVVSTGNGASLFRVAALPQFQIDPEELRAGLKAAGRESKSGGVEAVLQGIDGGPAVLATIQQTVDELAKSPVKSRQALEVILRTFQLNRDSPPVLTFLDFVATWEGKPITGTGSLSELVEYLEFFREATGVVSMPAREENAVHLVSAHGAKGLEFKHVFILRVNPASFPCSFRERLVEFPRELRDPDSFIEGDEKTLYDEEEMRLFYVAMTRARDSLTLYARKGKGKKDPTPPGLIRYLLTNKSVAPYIRDRRAHGLQAQIFAAATDALSRPSEWLSLPPVTVLHTRLSATAVETYARCPLQFKMEREWALPREVPAALHYGSVMHAVLKTCYDSIQLGRPRTLAELQDMFRDGLADASIQERYQHELYERQGIDQLAGFLARCEVVPAPDVLHTEQKFEIQIGGTTVAGRIDRIDRAPDGRVVVIDYKTGRSKTQKDADESLQLSIYALAAREKWNYEVASLAFYNLELNAPVNTVRDSAMLEAARCQVLDVAKKIAEGNFEAKPGFYCSFCPYLTLCPAKEKKFYSVQKSKRAFPGRG
jgi:superfamily I DNA/RNA helicase/RecB family exonuclease